MWFSLRTIGVSAYYLVKVNIKYTQPKNVITALYASCIWDTLINVWYPNDDIHFTLVAGNSEIQNAIKRLGIDEGLNFTELVCVWWR